MAISILQAEGQTGAGGEGRMAGGEIALLCSVGGWGRAGPRLPQKKTKEPARLRLGPRCACDGPEGSQARRPAPGSPPRTAGIAPRDFAVGAVPRGVGCLAASFVSAYSPSCDKHKHFQTLPDLSRGGMGPQ